MTGRHRRRTRWQRWAGRGTTADRGRTADPQANPAAPWADVPCQRQVTAPLFETARPRPDRTTA